MSDEEKAKWRVEEDPNGGGVNMHVRAASFLLPLLLRSSSDNATLTSLALALSL